MRASRKKRTRRQVGLAVAGTVAVLTIATAQAAAGTLVDPWAWIAGAVVGGVAAAGAVLWARRRLAAWRVRRVLAGTDLRAVDAMSGVEFEHYVADLMRASRYRRVTVVGQARDGGVDIRAETPDGRPCAVQCKRLKRPVPPNDIRAFQGVLANSHRGYLGIFVASHGFTELAVAEAGDSMVLVGRDGIGLWMAGQRPPTLPPARSRR